ncbi:MAG: tetratricopeptide repeat protein [Pseudomonadota bacterium]
MSQGNKIQPQVAPLSHLADGPESTEPSVDRRTLAVGVIVLGVVGLALLLGLTLMQDPAISTDSQTSTPQIYPEQNERNQTAEEVAPFAATQTQRAREKAQNSLAAFVEKQISLEEQMSVDEWGQTQLRRALEVAEAGDAHFLAERFEESLAAYDEATTALDEVIRLGESVHTQHVSEAQTAFLDQDYQTAQEAIQAALRIKPSASKALALSNRIEQLPKIISLMRDAKNHELGGRPQQALNTYDQIARIDPGFPGLNDLRQAALADQQEDKVANYLSRGFAALNQQDFDRARQEFNQALSLEPGNEIAQGGLAQVAKDNDLAIIEAQRKIADAAIIAEDWSAASQAYQAVLDLDANIQFARSGLNIVNAHKKSFDLLNRIAGAPERLSNEKLFLEATSIVDQAKQLSQAGPTLRAATSKVADLIELYRHPVEVVLVSDNATDIVVSNVGRLGTFESKSLKLRPGEYTIRGSQNGCRDIYLTVQVLPGIEPVNLSCPERL